MNTIFFKKKNGNTESRNKKPSKLEISLILLLKPFRGTASRWWNEPADSLVSMHKQRPPYSSADFNEDWERTPASVTG